MKPDFSCLNTFNVPIRFELENALNVMFVGIGGGFDIFGALPLVYYTDTLHSNLGRKSKLILVNSWSPSKDFLYRVSTPDDYPEYHLPVDPENGVISYTVGRHGAQALKAAYQAIVDEHHIDTIIAIDGGVDSLMQGDEENAGTVLEDFVALAALHEVQVGQSLLACVGFGTETEEELNHYRVLENIAKLVQSKGFLGTCSLRMDGEGEFGYYYGSCLKAWKEGRKSHIHTKILSSAFGEFGDSHMYPDVDARLHGETNNEFFVSPLSSIYWFFRMHNVWFRKAHVLTELGKTSTFTDAMMVYRRLAKVTRDKRPLPL